ncbi:hypothetical protein [Clostridium caldaquaticum]|nr:hypothetical protein [Clostridium caldaquaticum]
MTNKKNNKFSNKENKQNEVRRAEGKLSKKHNPPKFENYNGDPIE